MDTPEMPPEPGSEARKRGRPPRGTEALRRDQVLKAAEAAFLDRGFGNASMEAVAKEAGVSKKTIYAFFATKEALFEAVMRCHIESSERPEPDINVRNAEELERALVDYLARLAQFILGPFAVRLFKASIAEADRFPEIAAAFYRQGGLRSIHQLEEWLKAQKKKGLLMLDDPFQGAKLLTSFVILEPLRAAALGVAPLPSIEDMRGRALFSAGIFLRGCAAK